MIKNKLCAGVLALLLCAFAPRAYAATGCDYPTSLDSFVDKISGDFLTVAEVNKFHCAIEQIEIRLDNTPASSGVSGGQTIAGGTGSGENLTLNSTAHATKGKIFFGSSSVFDEANQRIGVGVTVPDAALHVQKDNAVTMILSSAGSPAASNFVGRSVVGTHGSPTAVGSGAVIVDITGQGWDSSAFATGGLMRIATTEAWSGSAKGAAVEFWSVPTGSTSIARVGRMIGGYGLELDSGSSFLRLQEESANITSLSNGAQAAVYMKGDKLIIAYNDGGTMRWKYLDLTGTGVTWVATTSAP